MSQALPRLSEPVLVAANRRLADEVVEVYDVKGLGLLKPSNHRYMVICDAHDQTTQAKTLSRATYLARRPMKWCTDCERESGK